MSIGPNFVSFCETLRQIGINVDDYPGKLWYDIFFEVREKNVSSRELPFLVKDRILEWNSKLELN